MRIIKLLLFRRANEVIELNTYTDEVKFVDVYLDEKDEVMSHASFASENTIINSTNGFYFKGVRGDYLMFYIVEDEPKIRCGKIEFGLLDKKIEFKCNQITEKEWVFECVAPNNSFRFVFKPYVYDPYDDDGELDVNFGLWIISLYQDADKLKRVMKMSPR